MIRPRDNGAARAGWTENPDRKWFVPLFDLVCSHLERIGRTKKVCNRNDVLLSAGLMMPAGLQMDAFETWVLLRRELE